MKPHDSSPGVTPPLYPILFAYLFGIAAASRVQLSRSIMAAIMAALLFSALLSAIRWKRNRPKPFWAALFFWMGFLALQVQLYRPLTQNHVARFADRGSVVVEGSLSRSPERVGETTRLRVKAETLVRRGEATDAEGLVMVSVPDLEESLSYGDRVRFSARLRRPTNFNNPGGFDYRRYLAARGIRTTAFVTQPSRLIRVGRGGGNAATMELEKLRSRIRGFLDRHANPSSRPVLKALVLGERGTIPDSVREDFAVSGAAHIMAISGLHVGIIAFFLFRGFLWILRQSERITLRADIYKVSAVLTIPSLVLYTLIAGSRVTTIRATIMIVVYLGSILMDRPRNLYHTLALAALAITLFDPASLLEASFQLSFTAVLAILFLFPRIRRFFQRDEPLVLGRQGPWQWLAVRGRDLLFVSLAAMIGTGPLIAYHFNRVSPMGLIANFLVIPLLGFVAVPLSLASALLSFSSTPLAAALLHVASWIIDLTVSMIHILASLPGASFYVATPTLLEIALFYAFVFVLFNLRRSVSYRIALAAILIFGALDMGYWTARTHFNRTLRITSIDVGQGDCTLVEFPGGKRALIDGGGFYDDRFDVGKNVVGPFLWKMKIRTIDFLVLTHPDPDHLNGLKFIARNFRAKELWDSGEEEDSPFFREFMAIVRRKGIRRISLFRGDEPRIVNGVTVQPLNPPRQTSDSSHRNRKGNNRSLVLKVAFGNQSFLLPGDIEKEAEAELVASGMDLRSRVLKAPHHGSQTSSTPAFLSSVQPEIALFSGRQRSLFHLPNRKVIERYERFGCRILRTDLHGAITFETDGRELKIKTFRKPRVKPGQNLD